MSHSSAGGSGNVLEALGRLAVADQPSSFGAGAAAGADDDDSLPPNVPTECHRPLLTLRLLAKEWVRAKVHAKQLDAYIRSKIVPRGLRIKNDPGVPLPSKQFLDAWYSETEEASLELMSLLRQEHERNSGVLGGEIDQLSKELRKRIAQRDQFDAFTDWVVEGAAVINERLNGIVRSKYERDVEEYNRNRLAATVRPRTAPLTGRFGSRGGGGGGGWPPSRGGGGGGGGGWPPSRGGGRGGGGGRGRGGVFRQHSPTSQQTAASRGRGVARSNSSDDSSFGSPVPPDERFTANSPYRPEM